jgi:hypothetical protein
MIVTVVYQGVCTPSSDPAVQRLAAVVRDIDTLDAQVGE